MGSDDYETGYKKPPKHSQFKAGDIPNPNGRGGKASVSLKAVKIMTIEQLKEALNAALSGNLMDLKAIAENPKSTVLQVSVATALYKAAKNGDWMTTEKIIERIVGKVPDKIDTSITVNPFSNMTEEEKLAKARDVVAMLEKKKE